MKKILFIVIICAGIAPSEALSQIQYWGPTEGPIANPASQSLIFAGPSTWTPGTSTTLQVFLTYDGYSAFGLSYWLEVPTALAPFLSITGVTYGAQFPDPNSVSPNPSLFNSTSGAIPGYMNQTRDLGSTNASTPGSEIPPGTYQTNTLTFTLDAGAASLGGQSFTMRSTITSPRVSEVTDSQFNDNNINPPGMFVITIAGNCTFTVVSQASRKTHGAAGNFDIDLPLTGTPGIECRTGGPTNDHAIVVTFSRGVTVSGNPQAEVTSGTGMIGSDGMSNGGMVFVNGSVVTVPLTNVLNAQTIEVTIYGVQASCGPSSDFVIPMSLLTGDTTANGIVNSSDIAQTKGQVGRPITSSNFREDVTIGGVINASDVAVVKSYNHTALP